MVKKKSFWISVCIISLLLMFMVVGMGIFVYKRGSNKDIRNVFDEMIVKKIYSHGRGGTCHGRGI